MFSRAMLHLHGEERARAIHDHGNSADAILAAVLEAEAVSGQWERRKAELLAELDRQGITDRRRGLKTPGYVAQATGVDAGRVRRDLHVGQVLRSLPVLRDAVEDGIVSIDHARAVALAYNPRIAAGLVELQDLLIDRAGQIGLRQWTRELRDLEQQIEPPRWAQAAQARRSV